jgi:hypothetical protein
MVGLRFLPRHETSEAREVSLNGRVVVGASQRGRLAGDIEEAFYWTGKAGMQGIDDQRCGAFKSRTYGVNEDGWSATLILEMRPSSGSREGFIIPRTIFIESNSRKIWTQIQPLKGLDADGGLRCLRRWQDHRELRHLPVR